MTALLLATLLLAPPSAAVPTQVEVQDPAGDSGRSPTNAPAPDLRSVAVGVTPSGELVLRARFTAGTFDAVATYVQFSLQLGRTNSTPDSCAQCGNYLVDFDGIGEPSQAAKVQRLGSTGRYEVVGTVPVGVTADRIRIAVPVKLLPSDLCRVEFRVVAGVRLRDDALSIILDRAPDGGMPSGVLKVPKCGRTRR
jgi:hypothetical protein